MIEKDQDAEFTGKYEEAGRVGGLLLNRFYSDVRALLEPTLKSGARLLEVGCGAGYSTERLFEWLPNEIYFQGCDIGISLLEKAKARNPAVEFTERSVYSLGFPDKSFDVIVMLEVLEHLDNPMEALAELRRVARDSVILSTPREPIWRMLNMLRGKYLRELGNTPGHIQHWSSGKLRTYVRSHFDITAMRRPLPWTILSLAPRS